MTIPASDAAPAPQAAARRHLAIWAPGAFILLLAVGLWWRGGGATKPAGARPPVPVEVAKVERRALAPQVRAVGTVTPLQHVSLRPQVDGIIAALYFDEGQMVKAGQLMAKLDARPFAARLAQARGELASQQAQLGAAAAELARQEALAAQDLVSAQAMDELRARVAQRQATVAASKAAVAAAEVTLSYARIVTPIAGRVGLRKIMAGNVVRAAGNDELATVTQLAPISVVFALPQAQLPMLTKLRGQAAPVEVIALAEDGATELARGTLAVIDNAVNRDTGAIAMRAHFANEDGALWPGQFVTVRLATTAAAEALVLSPRAIRRGANGTFVFRVAGEVAEMVPVVLGHQDQANAVVAKGLAEGDVVVVDGHSRLVPGARVRVVEGGGQVSVRGGVARFCIERPVATTLLALGICLLGAFSFPRLPVAPLPEAEFPTLEVSANIPGASPATMASSVATPLEVALSAVPGITEMTSSSAYGSTSITLQFELSKSLDAAALEVQSALNSASGRLPRDMPSLPTWRKVNPGDSPILVLSATSDVLSITELTDAVETRLVRRLSQLDGVAEIWVRGARRPALRIAARPQQLAAYGLTLADLRQAIAGTSANQATGALFGEATTSTISTNSQLFDAAAYEAVVVAYKDGAAVRLGDVARIVQGAENDYEVAWPGGKEGVVIIARRQPSANIIETADRIKAEIPRLVEQLPAGVEVQVLNDRTRTIRSSLHEVELTLVLTVILVVLIMGAFLRQLSATLIVAATLVIALVATFGAMYLAGYSLNNLTLVALIIAVGFVVDDAIVVIENIHRHLEAGAARRQAAIDGASEVGFTVISISVSLIAAFIPLLFMGGVVGRLFREFALVVAIAVMLSVVISLTVTPMLASVFMNAPKSHAPHEAGGGWLARLVAAYGRGLRWAMAHPRATMTGFFAAIALAVYSYATIPKGFFPVQDTAFIQGSTEAAQDISFADMQAKHQQLAAIISQEPGVMAYLHFIGSGPSSQGLSSGRFFIVLKDRGDRDVSVEGVIDRLRPKLAQVPGIVLYLRAAQDINLGGFTSRTQYAYVLSGADSDELATWAVRLTQALQKDARFTDVSSDLKLGAAVTPIEIDRAAAARYGISVRDVGQMLYDAFGQRQVGEYQTEVNQYKVILEIDPQWRGKVESLDFFHLRSPVTGEMVPLAALAKVMPMTSGPQAINHVGMLPSVNISFNLAAGVALGDAVTAVQAAKDQLGVPGSLTGRFSGSARAFADSLATQPMLILMALIAVYIILGVLYESFIHPLTILSTLPSAGVGAILMLRAFGFDFSIMALIGIVMLIGIVKKNGIMMVDFAIDARRGGMAAHDAVYQAALVRFRPILMTTLAALLAAIPLTLGLGTGSELRQPLGFAVVGGLLVSQLLTLFTTPVIYLTLDRLSKAPKAAA